jgi:hypothetical protein
MSVGLSVMLRKDHGCARPFYKAALRVVCAVYFSSCVHILQLIRVVARLKKKGTLLHRSTASSSPKSPVPSRPRASASWQCHQCGARAGNVPAELSDVTRKVFDEMRQEVLGADQDEASPRQVMVMQVVR